MTDISVAYELPEAPWVWVDLPVADTVPPADDIDPAAREGLWIIRRYPDGSFDIYDWPIPGQTP